LRTKPAIDGMRLLLAALFVSPLWRVLFVGVELFRTIGIDVLWRLSDAGCQSETPLQPFPRLARRHRAYRLCRGALSDEIGTQPPSANLCKALHFDAEKSIGLQIPHLCIQRCARMKTKARLRLGRPLRANNPPQKRR
jgi:hypothetical protein